MPTSRPRVYDDPDIDDQMLLRPSVMGWHVFEDGSLLIRIRGEHLVSVVPPLARRLLDGLEAAADPRQPIPVDDRVDDSATS